MAIIQEGTTRWTAVKPITYREQEEAARQLRYTKAARVFWQTVKAQNDYGAACEALRHYLDEDERKDEDFMHILGKMRP